MAFLEHKPKRPRKISNSEPFIWQLKELRFDVTGEEEPQNKLYTRLYTRKAPQALQHEGCVSNTVELISTSKRSTTKETAERVDTAST